MNSINGIEKSFLPINTEYSETMASPQEEVENNPRKFIIEECIPACFELWKKNIYTFMVSDHLNIGECWVEVIEESLSSENKEIYENLSGEDMIKFSYHNGTLNFGVKCVGIEGQRKLLELAKQFKMQDVPINQAYLLEKEFLMLYCGCYEEIENPKYKFMKEPWELDLGSDNIFSYMQEYEKWQNSEESMPVLKVYDPSKVLKSVAEYAKELGMVYEDGRVYLNAFHYKKHNNYLKYINTNLVQTTNNKEFSIHSNMNL